MRTTILLLVLVAPAAADYRIITRTSSGRNGFTTTRLIQGGRQREQTGNGGPTIFQCDRQQVVQLNPELKLYRIIKLAADGYPAQRPATSTLRRYKASTTTLPEKVTLFGRPAWHVRDVIQDVETGFRSTLDSWYIDAPIAEGCASPGRAPSPLDQPSGVERSGDARRGFAVMTRRFYLTPPGHTDWTTAVTEFQETKLDPSLFEIPRDYREALDVGLTIPDTPANRAKQAWDTMWLKLARFIYG